MKLALNCPTQMLESIQPFGDIDWINAHRYLNDKAYAQYYQSSKNQKFIDPGTCESGEPNVSIGDLKKIQEELGIVAIVVAPDYPNDMQATLKAYNECLNAEIESRYLMAVLQGARPEEILDMINIYSYLGDDTRPAYIGVPYGLLSTDSQGKRYSADWMGLMRVTFVLSIPIDRLVHLLGFVSLEEFKYYRGRTNVISINTGVPILQGLQGNDIDPESFREKKLATLNQMEEMKLTSESYGQVARNIALLRKYMSFVS